MPSHDASQEERVYGFPKSILGPKDLVLFQQSVPLPMLSGMLNARVPNYVCLMPTMMVGTSHNCGVPLASTAASISESKQSAGCFERNNEDPDGCSGWITGCSSRSAQVHPWGGLDAGPACRRLRLSRRLKTATIGQRVRKVSLAGRRWPLGWCPRNLVDKTI